jgi:ribosomal protein S18 acetylase RimI-like enzyme
VQVTPTRPEIRRADLRDASTVAELWLQSFRAAMPSVRIAHTDDQVRHWIRDVVIEQHETWLICLGDEIAGMMTLNDGDIDQLYLSPSRRGQGLGGMLIAHAKTRQPDGLRLWSFQVNDAAVAFYRRHGFRETARTDGSRNEEREPDIRMEWTPGNEGPV